MNAKVLVTGATGFLGGHIASLLEQRGEAIRILSRAAPPGLDREGVEVVEGSLLDDEALDESLRGVEAVYHAAGLVARDEASSADMFRLHVEGTRRLFERARAAGVRRVLLASSSGTIAVTKEEAYSDEDAPYRIETVRRWPYYLSKIYQEKLALQLAAEGGPEVVVVSPSLLLGPGDVRLSSTGDLLRFLRRQVPIVPSGGISFVDARDAAAGAILAMERGEPSRRYLLAGANWPMEAFFQRLSRISGIRGPTLRVPDGMARLGARVLERGHRALGSRQGAPVDATSVEMSQHFWYCDTTRASEELGWEPRDPMETLEDTVACLRERYFGEAPRQPKPPSHLELLVMRGPGEGMDPARASTTRPAPATKKEERARADQEV